MQNPKELGWKTTRPTNSSTSCKLFVTQKSKVAKSCHSCRPKNVHKQKKNTGRSEWDHHPGKNLKRWGGVFGGRSATFFWSFELPLKKKSGGKKITSAHSKVPENTGRSWWVFSIILHHQINKKFMPKIRVLGSRKLPRDPIGKPQHFNMHFLLKMGDFTASHVSFLGILECLYMSPCLSCFWSRTKVSSLKPIET